MENYQNYLNSINTNNQEANQEKNEEYQKKELDLQHFNEMMEPINLVGSEMLYGGLKGLGGKVINRVGQATGSQVIKNIGEGVRKGEIKDVKSLGKNLRSQAKGRLSQSGQEIADKASKNFKGAKAELSKVKAAPNKIKNRVNEAQKRSSQRSQTEKTIEEKSEEGRASDVDDTKFSMLDPATDKPTRPKKEPVKQSEDPREVLDDDGKPIIDETEKLRQKQEEQERKGILNREDPLDKQIIERTEQEQRARSTAAEVKKSPLQAIEEAQARTAPPPPPPGQTDKPEGEGEDITDDEDINEYEPPPPPQAEPVKPTFDPTAPVEGEFTGTGGQFKRGGLTIEAGEDQPKGQFTPTEDLPDPIFKGPEKKVSFASSKQIREFNPKSVVSKEAALENIKTKKSIRADFENLSSKDKIRFTSNSKGLGNQEKQDLMNNIKSTPTDTPEISEGPAAPAPAPAQEAPAQEAPTQETPTDPTEDAPKEEPTIEKAPTEEDAEKGLGGTIEEGAELGLADVADPLVGLGLTLLPSLLGGGDDKPSSPAPTPNVSYQAGTN